MRNSSGPPTGPPHARAQLSIVEGFLKQARAPQSKLLKTLNNLEGSSLRTEHSGQSQHTEQHVVVTNSNEYLSALKTADPLLHNIKCKRLFLA